ncbi:MAG: SDR family oxidoreductase [Pseudomonadota bacterium]
MLLSGKRIIITGASSGIGAAAARLFAAEGAAVVLGARRSEALETLVSSIRHDGGTAWAVAGDIAAPGCAEGLVRLAEKELGGIDGAFNNAGITGAPGPVETMEDATWQGVMDINLTAAFRAARVQIPALRRAGGGAILFTSSFVGHSIGLPGMGAYAASKAGLVGLCQVIAAEHGREGIRANCLLPGGTRTPMAGEAPETLDRIAALHALKRMAEPEEIAHAALFLLSDMASFVTGAAILADGGNSIFKP